MAERRVIVITGASAGIGRALALEAARNGFAVVAVARDREDLETLHAEIQASGGACVTVLLDVTQSDAAQRIVTVARERFGGIDVLVNNAGAAIAGPLFEQSDAQIDGQWYLHVAAPLRITRAAFALLKERHGQVFFVGSGLARVPAPYYGAYCAAKAGVRALATQLRRELRGTGVAVTYLDPGSVRTNFGKTAGIPPYGPSWAPVKPGWIAKRVLQAIRTRPHRLNAVPLHTLGAMLGEWFPTFADRSITPPMPQPLPQPPPLETPSAPQSDFERALEPVARRMERTKLSPAFLAELLQPGTELHLGDAAMRWTGMPNKNERAALAEAFEALAAGGFLERSGEESWRVLRDRDGSCAP